jgi:hypothetical protein
MEHCDWLKERRDPCRRVIPSSVHGFIERNNGTGRNNNNNKKKGLVHLERVPRTERRHSVNHGNETKEIRDLTLSATLQT